MELTFGLEYKDYKIFCARAMKCGPNSTPKYKYAGTVVSILIWIVIGFFLAYLFREMRTTERSMTEVFGPTIIIMIIFGIIAKFYSAIYQRRMEPATDGFILGKKTFRFTENGIEEESKHFSNRLSWDAVTNIVNDLDYIYLFLDVSAAHIIPKRIFESRELADKFLEDIERLRANNAT